MERAAVGTAKEELAAQLHDVNVHWLELPMVAGEDCMKKARLLNTFRADAAVQLHNVNARLLQPVIVIVPVMYIGIPAIEDSVAMKVDL